MYSSSTEVRWAHRLDSGLRGVWTVTEPIGDQQGRFIRSDRNAPGISANVLPKLRDRDRTYLAGVPEAFGARTFLKARKDCCAVSGP